MSLLLPQLSIPAARQAFSDFVESGKVRSNLAHEHQVYSALGGSKASQREVDNIAATIRGRLGNFDFRARATLAQKREFDDLCGEVLLHALSRVSAHQASQPGVWRFMCCVMFPDIVLWRWGRGEGTDLTEERYLHITRNTFARLWKRAYVLQTPDTDKSTHLVDALNEDELVQILERPTIGGNRQLAVCLARGFLEVLTGRSRRSADFKQTGRGREALMRQLTRGVIRRGSVLSIDAMTSNELEQFVGTELDAAIAAFARSAAP